jgi:hypothetical protein
MSFNNCKSKRTAQILLFVHKNKINITSKEYIYLYNLGMMLLSTDKSL